MRSPSTLQIQPYRAGIGWPHAVCPRRGDLGCLAAHAKAAGYRADDLATRLGIGSRALRHIFRQSLGIPLKKWLGDMRCLEVRRRLLTEESIQEIAYSVGFSHAKELAREFRKVYHVTPSDFRLRERSRAQCGKQEAGSRKQEAGSRKQEAGSRKQEAGSGKREAGSGKREAEFRFIRMIGHQFLQFAAFRYPKR